MTRDEEIHRLASTIADLAWASWSIIGTGERDRIIKEMLEIMESTKARQAVGDSPRPATGANQ